MNGNVQVVTNRSMKDIGTVCIRGPAWLYVECPCCLSRAVIVQNIRTKWKSHSEKRRIFSAADLGYAEGFEGGSAHSSKILCGNLSSCIQSQISHTKSDHITRSIHQPLFIEAHAISYIKTPISKGPVKQRLCSGGLWGTLASLNYFSGGETRPNSQGGLRITSVSQWMMKKGPFYWWRELEISSENRRVENDTTVNQNCIQTCSATNPHCSHSQGIKYCRGSWCLVDTNTFCISAWQVCHSKLVTCGHVNALGTSYFSSCKGNQTIIFFS